MMIAAAFVALLAPAMAAPRSNHTKDWKVDPQVQKQYCIDAAIKRMQEHSTDFGAAPPKDPDCPAQLDFSVAMRIDREAAAEQSRRSELPPVESTAPSPVGAARGGRVTINIKDLAGRVGLVLPDGIIDHVGFTGRNVVLTYKIGP
ncbi:MAG: hypothetical protein HY077_00195 [Elusimicrobia bacterium]|nr:hypothetical protein [Elusimicrobiota bacterium]